MSPITTLILLFLVSPVVLGAPALDSSSLKQNGVSAQQLNAQFASLKKTDSCNDSDMACVEGSFAQCVGGKWQTTACSGGTQCFVLPLQNKIGTSITCDTQANAESRISDTGVSGGLTGLGASSNVSLATLDSSNTNCTDRGGVNSTAASLGAVNSTDESNGNLTSTDTDTGASADGGVASTSTSCASDAGATTTVTVTASETFRSAARSATLAPGVTIPAPNASVTATSSASEASSTPFLNSTDTGIASPTSPLDMNITETLSPASASALFSSLSAANPDISIITLSDSSAAAASATTSPVVGANAAAASEITASASASSPAISLSLFSTTLASANQTSLAAIAEPTSSSAAGGYSGYGYRVRRVGRGF